MIDSTKSRLAEIRLALIALHKALVDSERITYEKTMGTIQSPSHFLQLLTQDPWFAWLQPLSRFIVSLDELDEAEEPLKVTTLETVIKEARLLLTPSEIGEGFARHYFDALQCDTQVLIAHAETMKTFGRVRA